MEESLGRKLKSEAWGSESLSLNDDMTLSFLKVENWGPVLHHSPWVFSASKLKCNWSLSE